MAATKIAFANVAGVVNANSYEQSQASYTKWADRYDQDMQNLKAGPPAAAAKAVMEFTNKTNNIRILDLAAGTGQVGVELKKMGYQGDIEGIDANNELLKVAKKNGIYSKLSEQAILEEEKLNADLEAYDFVTCIAALIPNHVPASSVKAMVVHLKKGGMLLYTTRTTTANVSYKRELDRAMEEMVQRGLVQFIKEEDVTHYAPPDPLTGNIVTSSLFTYKKL